MTLWWLWEVTDSTRQASIDKAVRSLVAEPDLELSLPSEPDDNILDKVTSGKTTCHLVLLPYKDKADKDFVGFIMKTDERKGGMEDRDASRRFSM